MKLEDLLKTEMTFKRFQSKELPAATSFRLRHVASAVDDAIISFRQENHSLIKKYGAKREDGIIAVTDENNEAFQQEAGKLLNEEVELPGFQLLTLADLGDTKVSIDDLRALSWLFVNEQTV